jgi:outer membrane receptor protein involved in Fe transport
LWVPVEAWSFRATYGTSFRAPSLTELDATGGSHFLIEDVVGGAPSVILSATGYAVSDLKPETARTYTAGFDYESAALPGFRASGTYYNIDYTDRIGVAPTGGLDPFDTPLLLPDLIYRPPSAAYIEDLLRATRLLGNLTSIDISNPQTGAAALFARNDVWIFDSRFKNLAISRQDGIDLQVSQLFDAPFGDLNVGASLSYILNYEQQGSSTAPIQPAVDVPGQPADWRGRAWLGLTRGAFDGALSINHTDGYSNPAAPAGQQAIDSWTTADLSLSYDLLGKDARGGKGAKLTLSVQNLFDQDPPFLRAGAGSNIVSSVGFDPANANPLGRLIVAGATFTW